MPTYGQSFTLADASKNGLQSKTYGGGTAGKFTRARGFLSYYEVIYFAMLGTILHEQTWKKCIM